MLESREEKAAILSLQLGRAVAVIDLLFTKFGDHHPINGGRQAPKGQNRILEVCWESRPLTVNQAKISFLHFMAVSNHTEYVCLWVFLFVY